MEAFPKELDLGGYLGTVKKTEMRREEAHAKTQWAKGQAVEEVPVGHE